MIGLGAVQSGMTDFSQVATGGLMAAVWQGVLLATGVGILLRLLPKTPAAVRFAIWFGVFLLVCVLPIFSLWSHGAGLTQPGRRGPWLTLDARWSLAIGAIWVTASLVRAGTLVAAAIRVRTLWKRAKPVGFNLDGVSVLQPVHCDSAAMDGTPGLLNGSSETLPGTRRAQICTSDEVDRPTVIGFFSPKILIPEWLLAKLTAAELEQIVLHETGHLGRADDWMNLLQKVALVVFPLNPALAWVERRLCFERELACDERVLAATQAPKAYAACLATLAEHRLGRRGLALALGALGRESELGRRVGRILRRGQTMQPLHAKLVMGGAMLGLLVGAVGLELCPQVIGFTRASDQSAEVVTPGKVGNRLPDTIHSALVNNELASRLNVLHQTYLKASLGPEVSGDESRLRRLNARAESSVYGMAKAMDSSKKHLTKSRSSGDGDASRAIASATVQLDQRSRPTADGAVEWVVVTSWQGADGSRLVLTTARTSSAMPRVVSDTPTGQGDARALQEQQHSEQVHPYAAVPVRGGWLVFQL